MQNLRDLLEFYVDSSFLKLSVTRCRHSDSATHSWENPTRKYFVSQRKEATAKDCNGCFSISSHVNFCFGPFHGVRSSVCTQDIPQYVAVNIPRFAEGRRKDET